MPTQDEIHQQLRRLEAHRATLAHYLDQVSQLGSAHTPPGVGHGIREARAGIARCKAAQRGWGVAVEDHPDDGRRARDLPRLTARRMLSARCVPLFPMMRRRRPPASPAC
jgi:hypothetical protein